MRKLFWVGFNIVGEGVVVMGVNMYVLKLKKNRK